MTKFKRKSKQKADAILVSDCHLRESTPLCRTDDFWETQNKKIDFLFDLAKKEKCPIFIAGDIGQKPRWSCRLLEWFISKINKDIKIFAIPGQHDLINHRLDLWDSSAIGVLQAAKVITLLGFDNFPSSLEFNNFWLHGFPYGVGVQNIKELDSLKPHIAMTHEMIIEKVDLFPNQNAIKGNQILKKHCGFSIVHSGDNHNAFTVEYKGRWLVNPGSLMRTTTDQVDHKPRVYLWYSETNEIKPVYLPIEQGVISRTHIEVAKDRENRNQAFIQRVNSLEGVEIDYEDNLAIYFKKYKTEIAIRNKTMEAVH